MELDELDLDSFSTPIENEIDLDAFSAPVMQDTGQSLAASSGNQFLRDIGSVIPNIVGGVGDTSEALVRNWNPVAWAAMAGVPGAQSLVDLYSKPGEFLSGTVADSMTGKLEEMTPTNPLYADSFTQKASGAVGQGVGQLASFAVPAKVLGLAPSVARAVGLGGAFAQGAKSGTDTAEAYGIEDDLTKAAMTLGFGGIETVTEKLGGLGAKGPTEAILGMLRSATRPGTVATRAAKTIGSEAGEEIVAGQAQDWLTGAVVQEDPNRPGFATNGVPLPPDTFTMENLKNRLEEGALGAIGGAVFAGAEALGSRTPIDEALAARFQARTRLEELRQKDSLTIEEQDELSQIEAEDQNVAAWLNRQGIDRIRPIVDQFSQNPQSLAEALAANAERQGREREAAMWRSERGVEQAADEISEYKGLVDALYDAESAGNEAAVTMAQQAIDDHVMNRMLNETNRTSQERSLDRTYKDKVAKLREGIKAAQQAASPVQQAADQLVSQVAQEAPQSAQALDSILKTSLPTESETTTPQTDAISKPIPETSLPRQEGPEVGLPAVGEGDAQGQETPTTSPQEEVNAPVPPSTQQPTLAQPAVEEDYALPPLKSQLNKAPIAREDAEFAKESYLQANPERAPFLQNAWIGSTKELAQDKQVRDAVIAGRNMGRETPLTPAQEEQEWRLFLMRRHEGFQFGDRPYILLDRVVVTDRDLRRSIKYGMKPEQWAVRRLIAHEDRHVLTNFLAANDELGTRFRELAARIPDAQLDDLANRRYPEFSDWRTSEIAKRSLQLEWFSEQAESDSPTDPTLLQQFLELLRELYAKVMGISPEDVQDVELRQFLKRASQLQAQYAQQQLGSGIQEGFQASMPEDSGYNYPPVPDTPDNFQDWIPVVDKARAKQLAWESFYRANADENGNVDLPALTAAWKQEIARPDSPYLDAGQTEAFMEARRRPAEVYDEPRELTAPETGPRQIKRKTPAKQPTPEDIASRYPQFSQPELSPEDEIAQIRQRAERSVSMGQQEGMDPVQATKDERTFSQSGRQADFSREGQTNAEQNADAQREMDLLISLSPDGPSLDLGQGLLSYLKGGNDPNGAPGNLLARMNMVNYLDRQPQLRNLLGIDGAELERIRQQYLTVGGTILQTAAGNRIYEPMRKMEETANKLVSDNAQMELGSSDFETMTKQVSADLTNEAKARVDSLEPDMVDALDLGAVKDVDFLGYSLALESFDQPTRLQIIDLLNELAELEDLLKLEAEMTAGPDIVQPSRPDIRSQNLTLAEVRQRIAAKQKKITKLVEDINKAKAENPVDEAKKIRAKVRKPRTPEVTSAQNDRMRGWVKGGKLDGVPTLYNVLKKYSQSNGLNRDSVFKVLMTTFPEADPNYILGVVNRMGDLLDGVATKEGILDDLKRSGAPDQKMVEKMLKVTQKAAIGKRKAIESFKNKLAKVKNPTPKKLRQRSTFVNSVIGAVETGMVDSDAVKDAFAEAYDLHGLTKERLQEMGDILQQIEAMPEGIPKETLFIEFNVLLNELAPTAKFSTFAHEALMGYVLSGASTMAMQLTGLGRFINPLAGTVEALWSAPGTTAQKIGRTVNPVNIFRVYLDGMQEVLRNIPQVAAGMSGVVTSKPEGLGAFPTTLANTRVNETSMSYTPAGRISQFRFQTPKLLQKMGLEPLVKLTRYPAWMVSRSFQVIRAAEGLVGTADRSMQWRMQMTYALMAGDKRLSFSQAYNKVSEALGDKTSQLWEDAKKQAKEEISKKLVGKMSLNARANEIVQDKIEEQWKKNLQNRPRELAALYGYKQDPITPLGAWAYGNISKLLHKNEGLLQYSKFSFLFARFFSNAIEAAWTRTPVGGLFALTLPSQKAENEMDEREKRIVQIFGSLQNYKDARMARAMSGTAMMAGLAGLMVMALKGWDPEDDEPPFFWITGDPIGEFSKKGLLEAGGWWKANTLYLGPLRLNYVNANPELATVIGAMGSMGDRFLFDKLLNYRENKETGEYERSNYQAYGKPVLEAFVAPVTRSTYRSWWDAAEALWQGDPTKVTKLISNPVVGTATALSPAGLVPTVKSLEKIDRANEQPRSPKTSAQAFMSSVPFADELGLDAGKPLTTPFGQPLTPYPFWSFMSNTQDVPPHVAKAANTLALLGVSRLGPREEYFGWGMGELSSDGKKYLLNDADRAVVLAEIGTRFANKVNANAAELKKLEAGKDGTKKVRNKVSNLAEDARKEVLRSWSSAIKK